MREEINFSALAQFQDKQLFAWYAIFADANKYILYGGAMGGGKSYLLRWAALGLTMYYSAMLGKTVPVGLFSEDYPTLKDRQISKIVQEFPPKLGKLKSTQSEGLAYFVKEKYGGGRILLRNLDDPAKYMSTEFAAILVEELTKNPFDTFLNLRTRLRYPGVANPKFVGASNPGGVGHFWCKNYFIDKNNADVEKDRFAYIPATVYDNKYLDENYRIQLESLPEQRKKAYLLGDWNAFEGAFFPMFDPIKQIVTPYGIPKEWKLICAIDPGWGGICAAGLLAQDFTGTFHLISTYYEKGRNNTQNAEGIKSFWSTNKFTNGRKPELFISGTDAFSHKDRHAIISSEATFADIFRQYDMILFPAVTDRVNGWGTFKSLMPDRFYIFKDLNNPVVEEIISVPTDENDINDIQGKGYDQDVVDHGIDFCRYGIMSSFKPIAPPSKPPMPNWMADLVKAKANEPWSLGK